VTALAVVAAVALLLLDLRGPARSFDPLSRRLARHVACRAVPPRRRRSGLRRLDRHLVRMRAMASVEQSLRHAGVALSIAEALLAACGGIVLAAVVAAVLGGPLAGAAAGAVVPGLAWIGLGISRDRRGRRIDGQLPEALDLLVGELRGHRSAPEAIAEVARRLADPLRAECARTVEEMALGVPLRQALEGLRRRVPSRPLAAAVTAVLVAERTGGDLAECLARQSQAVREQIAFLQEVRAVTAHARATAAFLTLLPVGVGLAMLGLDPAAMRALVESDAGRLLLGTAAGLQLLGWYMIRTMIRSVTP